MSQLLLTVIASEKVVLERNRTACGAGLQDFLDVQEPPEREGLPKCCLSPGPGFKAYCPEQFPKSPVPVPPANDYLRALNCESIHMPSNTQTNSKKNNYETSSPFILLSLTTLHFSLFPHEI